MAGLAKCLVCSDDASGFHYGVNACEGCKGFFRRCITQGINFRCSNEEKCLITPFTRNSCQYCRLKKCFQAGMSREASRLGRRPKKTVKSNGFSREFRHQLSKHIDSKSDPASEQSWDFSSLAKATISDMFGLPADMMQQFSQHLHSGFHGMGMMEKSFLPPAVGYHMTNQNNYSTANNDSVSHMDLCKWREKQYQVMSKYMHSNKEQGIQNPEINSSEFIETRLDEVDSLSCTITSSPSDSSCQSVFDMKSIMDVSEFHLKKLNLYKEYSMLERSQDLSLLIEDVQRGIIKSHFKHCYQLRPRVNAASAELDAREMSGEDVRPPSGFWEHWMTELLPAIERVVRYIKDVPGFRELPINDQILLIKKGAFSVMIVQAMPMVDPIHMTLLDPSLKYRNNRSDFSQMPPPFRKIFEDQFVLAKEFLAYNVSDVEAGLINAIIAVGSDVEGFENQKAVEKLECLFVQTLHDQMCRCFPDYPERFDKLIRLIPMVDNLSAAHSNTLNSIKYNSPYTNVSSAFPPLHQEIFS